MGRNTKEIELFDEKLILSERSARDVLAFSDFANKSSEEKTVGIALYQAAIIVEAALKNNIKELPHLPKVTFWKRILRFLGLDKEYKTFLNECVSITEFNSKLKSSYLLQELSQKELFDFVRELYLLEGIKIDEVQDTKKK